MTMREKMARALIRRRKKKYFDALDETHPGQTEKELDHLMRFQGHRYLSYADAVLDAQLDATDSMLVSGGNNGDWSGRSQGCEGEEALSVWQAMIRAAKEGK
jgi:hypothetical protein